MPSPRRKRKNMLLASNLLAEISSDKFSERHLSHVDRLIYLLYIAAYQRDGVGSASMAEIAAAAHCHRNTVRRSRDHLVDVGLMCIRSHRRKGMVRLWSVMYPGTEPFPDEFLLQELSKSARKKKRGHQESTSGAELAEDPNAGDAQPPRSAEVNGETEESSPQPDEEVEGAEWRKGIGTLVDASLMCIRSYRRKGIVRLWSVMYPGTKPFSDDLLLQESGKSTWKKRRRRREPGETEERDAQPSETEEQEDKPEETDELLDEDEDDEVEGAEWRKRISIPRPIQRTLRQFTRSQKMGKKGRWWADVAYVLAVRRDVGERKWLSYALAILKNWCENNRAMVHGQEITGPNDPRIEMWTHMSHEKCIDVWTYTVTKALASESNSKAVQRFSHLAVVTKVTPWTITFKVPEEFIGLAITMAKEWNTTREMGVGFHVETDKPNKPPSKPRKPWQGPRDNEPDDPNELPPPTELWPEATAAEGARRTEEVSADAESPPPTPQVLAAENKKVTLAQRFKRKIRKEKPSDPKLKMAAESEKSDEQIALEELRLRFVPRIGQEIIEAAETEGEREEILKEWVELRDKIVNGEDEEVERAIAAGIDPSPRAPEPDETPQVQAGETQEAPPAQKSDRPGDPELQEAAEAEKSEEQIALEELRLRFVPRIGQDIVEAAETEEEREEILKEWVELRDKIVNGEDEEVERAIAAGVDPGPTRPPPRRKLSRPPDNEASGQAPEVPPGEA